MIRKINLLLLSAVSLLLPAQNIFLDNGYYQVLYSVERMQPVRVEWTLDKQYLGNEKRESSWKFREDKRLPSPRVSTKWYNGSGYDRGHLCPSADWTACKKMMKGTFLMSNICPQTPAVNRKYWLATENYSRKMAHRYGKLKVVAMPIFYSAGESNTRCLESSNTSSEPRTCITIPECYFKCVYDSINHQFCKWWVISNSVWR